MIRFKNFLIKLNKILNSTNNIVVKLICKNNSLFDLFLSRMSFSEGSLLKKFQELNNTQQSVQTLSLWLIHHRKHSEKIVKTWLKELINSNKCERKLTFIYLANDILQNSRKKGYEYLKEFANVLPESIENTAKYADTKIRFTLERILNIWKDRKICDDEMIDQLKSILHSTPSLTISPESQSKSNEITEAASKSNFF